MHLALHHHTLHLKQAFTIARSTRTQQRTTIVELSDSDGNKGYGEVADNEYYVQAHPETVDVTLRKLVGILAEADPDNPEALFAECLPHVDRNYFALSALDMAAHDLAARRAGEPLYVYWGLDWEDAKIPVSNYTLSIDGPQAVLAQARANPWPSYKVKLGGNHDIATIDLLRRELVDVQLCVDANAGWSDEEAFAKTVDLTRLGVLFVEQPKARGAFAKTQALRQRLQEEIGEAAPPLVADEDCQTEADVAACAEAYDAINIKLSKCGGPTPALRMVREARQRGLGVMFGCMIESSFAIGVLRHFSAAADFIDLDGHLLVRDDVGAGIEFLADGRPARPTGAGSGVHWRKE